MAASSQQPDLSILFPGTIVEIADGLKVTVYPVGIVHLKRFNMAVEQVLPRIASQIDLNKLGDSLDDLLPVVVPILLTDLLEMMNECVEGLDLLSSTSPVPHWVLPMIAEAWFEISFGDVGKVRPWIQVIDTVIAKITGQNPGIWEKLSASLHRQASVSQQS